ncbi:MAG: hypothetical protein KDA70_02000 [Planctomycetaceae bacterium]|nr:hypothetical protein [Planctomycetaceae bacterium]MCA9022704.1 hypothetical protein [Planctomycetaceae bacterium]
MKSTLTTILVILVLASLLSKQTPFFSETVVKAQPPAQVSDEPLSRQIDRFLESEVERGKHRDRPERPDREREHMRHHSPEDRPGEPRHPDHREHERRLDEQRHRIQKMHVAAEHLQDAGLPELAHQVHREAEEQHQRLQQHLEHRHHPDHGPHHEVRESLQQLRNEVNELKREVHELRMILKERIPNSAR